MRLRYRRPHLLALCIVILLASGSASPQDSTVKLKSNLVLVDAITISKRTHQSITDLAADDFVVEEDGIPQTLTHFSRDEMPLAVVLLLDVSGSVRPVLDDIQQAALGALAHLNPDDRVALMIFATRPRLLIELTSDHQAVADRLDSMWSELGPAGWATFINTGVYEATRYLSRQTEPYERRAILAITDDRDTSRYDVAPPRDLVLRRLYETDTTLCAITIRRSELRRKARRAGATAAVTAISPPLGALIITSQLLRRFSASDGSAKYFAERTGGLVLDSKHDEVASHFAETLQVLRSRYTLGYEAPDVGANRNFRKIKLKLSKSAERKYGGTKIYAREGYFPQAPDRAH